MSDQHIYYSVTTYSAQYNIAPSFIQELHERGLIELKKDKEDFFIVEDQLPQLEHYTRLHCDFEINAAGIEVVEEMLSRVDELNKKMLYLESKLSLLRNLD